MILGDENTKLLTHDSTLGVLEELDDMLNLGAVGHLILDLVDNIEDTRLTMEQQTIGIGDVLLYFLVDSSLFHHRRVRASILEGFAACNDKRGDVARERNTSLYQCQTTNTGVGILDGRAGENDSVLNLAVASNLHTVTKHAMIAYDGIVADMSSFEQEIVVADNGAAITIGTTVDDDILTDDIIITYLHIRLLATEIEILRQGSNHTALMDLIVVTSQMLTKGKMMQLSPISTSSSIYTKGNILQLLPIFAFGEISALGDISLAIIVNFQLVNYQFSSLRHRGPDRG